MTIRKDLLLLRALHGLTGNEIAAGLDLEAVPSGRQPPMPARNDSLCWACDGQQYVFPGLPGKPMMLDTSRIVKCPVCHGTGKRHPQRRLPGF